MQLNVERNDFLKALAHTQSVVEKRTTIPVLSNILLEAEPDMLRLTATDLDIAVIEMIPAQVATPGRTTVSAHMLYDIVRKLREGSVLSLSFDVENAQLLLESGRSRFKLSTLPAEDFPVVSSGTLPVRFEIPARDLKKLIEKTRFAMSQEETMYNLNGIYMHAHGGEELRTVATDGHRLALASAPLPAEALQIPGVIIARKTVNELVKLIDEESGNTGIELSENQISFRFRNVFLTSRLVDATFPDYQRVIPLNNDKALYIDVHAFADAVDRVATVSSEKIRGIRVGLSNGRLSISATGTDIGQANEEMEVDYSSDPMEIGFNARYLLDVAGQYDDNTEVEILLADPGAPIVIREQSDKNALFVVMPMHV